MEVLMDMKQSLAIAVFVVVAIAPVVALVNLLMRERRQKVGYNYSGGGYADTTGTFPGQASDPSPFSGSHGGHHCPSGDSTSGDSGSCGGGDSGGGGD
jgi:uncharacterized membrane protein YgcG